MRPSDPPTPDRPALRQRGGAALALAIAVASAAACSPPDTAVRAAPAPRVVSLAPALTAIVNALDGAQHLVGVTAYCDAPGVPVVGDFTPRPEAVLAQRPDLVLMAAYGAQAPANGALSALGLSVTTVPLVTLADMRQATLAIGRLLRREAAAVAVIGAFDQALAVATPGPDVRRVEVLLVYDVQPGFVITTGGGDHVSELVSALGGHNPVSGPVTARVGLERVLEGRPDLILHVAPDARFPDSASALRHWSAWPQLPAVARGQVAVFPDDGLARNGPHLKSVVPRLAKLITAARDALGVEP